MSVNKYIYRYLYQQTCKGMSRVNRGSSSRYELIVNDPPESIWKKIREETGATGRDLNDFLQGARGNYSSITQDVDYELPLSEILPGEVISIVFQKQNDSTHGEIRILKLSPEKYLVLNSRFAPWKRASIYSLHPDTVFQRTRNIDFPEIGDVILSHIHIEKPSEFHRLLDTALLPRFRQTKVKNNITPLFCSLKVLLSNTNSLEEINQFLQDVAEYGISTFVIRQMADCLTAINNTER